MKYDIAIIGGGPAGYTAAERAAANGLRTVLFEKKAIGGVCLNEGCIPTKTLLYSAKLWDNMKGASKYGISVPDGSSYDMKKIIDRKDKIVKKLTGGVKMTVNSYGAVIVPQEAVIVGEADGRFQLSAASEVYEVTYLLVCTGSDTLIPPIKGLSEIDYWTSKEKSAKFYDNLLGKLLFFSHNSQHPKIYPYFCRNLRNTMVAPEIAIADSNTLSCMGLQSLLEEIIPMAVIRVFSSFEELMDDTPDMYAHYFVSAQIYFEHTAFFLPRKPKTIVLANGDNQPQLAGIPTLNIYQDEKTLIKNILQLHQFGHKGGHSHSHPHGHPHGATAHPCGNPHADSEHDLSPREIEVLVLITKGLINKEIADKLNISLTTVISHRKNITEKLGIKSVAGLTIYAVMHGYVEADRI